MCKSSVDGQPVGQSGIELRRQAGGCGIGDLELHSDDRRQALTDQTLRDTREGVGGRLPSAFAGVEDGQAQGAHIVQQRAQVLPGHEVAQMVGVLEGEHAVAGDRVEAAMTDEVQDVIVGRPQRLTQRRERRVRQRVHDDQPTLDEVAERFGDPRDLRLGVELGEVGRAAHGQENPQWRRDGERQNLTRQVEVTDDRRGLGKNEEATQPRGIQVFPGDVGERGDVGEPQFDTQALALLVRLIEAAPEAGADLSGEHRVVELTAEGAREVVLRGAQRADARTGAAELEDDVLEIDAEERHTEIGTGLPLGGGEDPGGVAAFTGVGEFEVEVEVVGDAGHQRPRSDNLIIGCGWALGLSMGETLLTT